MSYEELDEKVEYLDLSHRNLGVEGVLDVLLDLSEDKIIKHVNLSYNIALEEFDDPKSVEYFIGKMKKYLSRNKTLTAIDLAGNYLFYHHPHPYNDHKKNYEKELTLALKETSISHIDLSENNMTGFKGRELDGFLFFMQNYMLKKKAFQIRRTNLNSQGFLSLIHTLGVHSTLTYLDVSDNFGGLDPLGRNSSEGIQVFARALSQTPFLRTLKIARNFLRDNDAEHIANAIVFMPGFQDLDVSGNMLKHFSCRTIQRAICSHSITSYNPNDKSKKVGGFRDLDISGNNVGDGGIREICFAIERTKVLRRVNLRNCGVTDDGGMQLIRVLQSNSTIEQIITEDNHMSPDVEIALQAEVETNLLLLSLKKDAMAVNSHALPFETYHALLRKLKYLDDATLLTLHSNPTFVVPGADMTEALYLLSPPPRKQLIEEVVLASDSLVKRIERSREIAKRVDAEVRVGKRVLTWWRDIKKRKKMAALLNLTSKAVKINKEMHQLYDRSHETLDNNDDGSLGEGSEGSLVDADGESTHDGDRILMTTITTSTAAGLPMMITEDAIGTGGQVLEQGSASSVPES